jgi:hypothetical protein
MKINLRLQRELISVRPSADALLRPSVAPFAHTDTTAYKPTDRLGVRNDGSFYLAKPN